MMRRLTAPIKECKHANRNRHKGLDYMCSLKNPLVIQLRVAHSLSLAVNCCANPLWSVCCVCCGTLFNYLCFERVHFDNLIGFPYLSLSKVNDTKLDGNHISDPVETEQLAECEWKRYIQCDR